MKIWIPMVTIFIVSTQQQRETGGGGGGDWGPPLGEKDFEAGKKQVEKAESGDYNSEISAKMPKLHEIEEMDYPEPAKKKSNGQRAIVAIDQMLWPGGELPYRISTSYNDEERAIIAATFTEIQDKTCIKFRPRKDDDKSWFDIITDKTDGCRASIGYRGPGQEHYLNLGPSCRVLSVALHEALHVIGIFHEHTRPDRDQFVKILWDQVEDSQKMNFFKTTASQNNNDKICSEEMSNEELDSCTTGTIASTYDTPYDFESVMHYNLEIFSKTPGSPTMQILDPSKAPDPSRIGRNGNIHLSKNNIIHLSNAYKCEGKTGGGNGTEENGGESGSEEEGGGREQGENGRGNETESEIIDGNERGEGEIDGDESERGETGGNERGEGEIDGDESERGETGGNERGEGDIDGDESERGETGGNVRGEEEIGGNERGEGVIDGSERGDIIGENENGEDYQDKRPENGKKPKGYILKSSKKIWMVNTLDS